jgi:hypothetical protein
MMNIIENWPRAAGIAWGVLNGGFAPRAEDCECRAKADTKSAKLVPRSDADCSCKADAARRDRRHGRRIVRAWLTRVNPRWRQTGV